VLRVAACRRDGDGLWGYSGIMRYPDSGGMSAQARSKREAVRMQAASWFSQGMQAREVARRLRVSDNSAYVGGAAGGPVASRRWCPRDLAAAGAGCRPVS
jgi:putative transposase